MAIHRNQYASNKEHETDIPFKDCNVSISPFMLGEGILSDVNNIVADNDGGYKNTKSFSLFSSAPTNETFIGISQAGKIYFGAQANISAATYNSSDTYVRVYRIDSTGAKVALSRGDSGVTTWTSSDKVAFVRTGGEEYILGLETSSLGTYCHLFRRLKPYGAGQKIYRVGAEPIDQSGIVATPSTTGGLLGAGWVRIFVVAWRPSISGDNDNSRGAIDRDNYIDVELTGSAATNSVSLSSIPTTTWGADEGTGTQIREVYRTKVVANRSELDIEPAYLSGVLPLATDTTYSNLGHLSDANIVSRAQLSLAKYMFPTYGETDAYTDNLGMIEHLGRLMCWGLGNSNRLHIAGYTDYNGTPVLTNDWWSYSVDIPSGAEILDVKPINGKACIFTEDGIYVLNDASADPTYWAVSQLASMNLDNTQLAARANNVIVFKSKVSSGEYKLYMFDGYNMRSVFSNVAGDIDDDTILLPYSGGVLFVGGDADSKYIDQDGKLGSLPIPDSTNWSLGRHTDIESGEVLLASDSVIYSQNSSSYGSGAYATTRAYAFMPADESAWNSIDVFYTASGACSIVVNVDFDGAGFSTVDTITVAGTTDIGHARVQIPYTGGRYARMLRVQLVIAAPSVEVVLQGVVVNGDRLAPQN